MPVVVTTPATAPAAGLLDLALLGAESLERVQRTGRRRSGLSRAIDHESTDSGARQSEEQLAIHSELHFFLGPYRCKSRSATGATFGGKCPERGGSSGPWSLIAPIR